MASEKHTVLSPIAVCCLLLISMSQWTSSQEYNETKGCVHTGLKIKLGCPSGSLINVHNSVIARGYRCGDTCCYHDNAWCKTVLTGDNAQLARLKQQCNQQRTCTVNVAEQHCSATSRSLTNYQSIKYRCLFLTTTSTLNPTISLTTNNSSKNDKQVLSSSEPGDTESDNVTTEWMTYSTGEASTYTSDKGLTNSAPHSSMDDDDNATSTVSSSPRNTGMIVGIVVGVGFLLVLAVIIVLIVFWRQHSHEDNKPKESHMQPSVKDDDLAYSQEINLEENMGALQRDVDKNGSQDIETNVDFTPTTEPGDYAYASAHHGDITKQVSDHENDGNVLYSDINPKAKSSIGDIPVAVVSALQAPDMEAGDALYSQVDKTKKSKDEDVVLAENDMYVTGGQEELAE